MTAKDVAERYGCNNSTVRNWAAKNNVAREVGAGGISAFNFTEDDCLRFEQRTGRGWKKGKSRKESSET